MSDNFDRFSYKHRLPDGSAVFGAPHELHNEVLLVLPEHYFGEGNPWPAWVDVPNFAVEPGTQEAPSALRIGTEIHQAIEAAIRDLPPAEFRARVEQIVRDYNPGPRDRSGIGPDDDPARQIPMKRCPGCDEMVTDLFDGEVVPPGKVGITPPRKAQLCIDCWEIAENADVQTGAYGAASATWVGMRYVRGIPK